MKGVKYFELIFLFICLIGFTSSATVQCNSCSSCNSTIALADSGDIILLNSSIDHSLNGTCIDFLGKDNLTFDCQNFSNFILGPNNSNLNNYGIYLSTGSDNNSVLNCNISRFSRGIF